MVTTVRVATITAENNTKVNNSNNSYSKSNKQIIIITKCPTEPCTIFYTDTLSQSILIECRNPQHRNTGIEKIEERTRLPANPIPKEQMQPEDCKNGDVT